MEAVVAVLFLIGVVALYFLPAIVASRRNRASGPVFILNLFLGWTLLGWVLALVWAMTERTAREEAEHQAAQRAKAAGPVARAGFGAASEDEKQGGGGGYIAIGVLCVATIGLAVVSDIGRQRPAPVAPVAGLPPAEATIPYTTKQSEPVPTITAQPALQATPAADPSYWADRDFLACQSNPRSPDYHWSAIAAARSAVADRSDSRARFAGIWVTSRSNVVCGRASRGDGLRRFVVATEAAGREQVVFDDGSAGFDGLWAQECVGAIVTCRRT